MVHSGRKTFGRADRVVCRPPHCASHIHLSDRRNWPDAGAFALGVCAQNGASISIGFIRHNFSWVFYSDSGRFLPSRRPDVGLAGWLVADESHFRMRRNFFDCLGGSENNTAGTLVFQASVVMSNAEFFLTLVTVIPALLSQVP